MSGLFNQASLVLVPSGYKSGKVYSQIPENGNGDLTFTRASTATRVNSAGLIEVVGSGVPRLDYSQGSCPALLLEPERKNLTIRSNEFSTSPWLNVNSSFTANSAISPEGINNAGTASLNAISDARIQQGGTSISNNTTYTLTGYFKNISLTSGQTFNVRVNNALSSPNNFLAVAVVDLFNETVTASISGSVGTGYSGTASAAIVNVGNGWLRVSLTFTVGSSGATTNALLQIMHTNTAVSRSCYIYGCQFEAGAYATSYIPTTSATVTRVADACSKTGISSLIGQTEGVLFVDVDSELSNDLIYLNRSVTNSVVIYKINTGAISARLYYNSNFFTISSTPIFGNIKVAFAYQSGNSALFINGVKIATDTTSFAFTGALNELYLNSTAYFLGSNLKTINSALIFNTRLTDTQCISLTTL